MRQDTDVFDTDSFEARHPSGPLPRPEPRVRPKSYRRPSRRYETPGEMWAWHWVRMRVVLAWSAVGTSCTVAVTAGTVILSEFW